jgi:hypothetical protein
MRRRGQPGAFFLSLMPPGPHAGGNRGTEGHREAGGREKMTGRGDAGQLSCGLGAYWR